MFVRSMASRGRPGGLAAAVEDAAVILKASGKDIVLVETVGVGQGELDVASAVQTTVVVLTPGMGDEIQSLKAGLMEVADIYVVNKADLPGADSVARSIHAYVESAPDGWERPVVQTSRPLTIGIARTGGCHRSHGVPSCRSPDRPAIRRSSGRSGRCCPSRGDSCWTRWSLPVDRGQLRGAGGGGRRRRSRAAGGSRARQSQFFSRRAATRN